MAREISRMLGASESILYADSKVVLVPATDCAGIDDGVDEDASATAGSALRAEPMVVGADFDVAVEGVIIHKCRGSIVAFSISKSVEPNEELKAGLIFSQVLSTIDTTLHTPNVCSI